MSDEACSGEDLRLKLKAWLSTTGAPFEMHVARELLGVGLDIEQGRYFTDPDDNKTAREIDIIGRRTLQMGDSATLSAIAVIECKFAPTPWVLFRPPPGYAEETENFDRVATHYGQEWLRKARFVPAIRDGELWRMEARPGYSLSTSGLGVKSKTPNSHDQQTVNDLAYKAIQGVTKATLAIADELEKEASSTSHLAVLFPVIAVRGKLFETWLDDDDIAVREIDRGQLLWRNPRGAARPILIDVVTEGAIDRFAQELRDTSDGLVTHGQDAAQAVNVTGVY